jgi:mitogen-activated protein kinase kinase kinase
MGVIKFVDFGAAKVLAKNQRSIQRSRVGQPNTAPGMPPGMANNSLTGTPMYMSPEVIKNDKRGRHGAMDIWSMGCVVLEFATGRKPWSNLDNEWS